uniref:Uncharacterized protein n=1 Tax=viral metagenome TaxID=1070528 RepID=A0A6C0H7F6_9ZZZZ
MYISIFIKVYKNNYNLYYFYIYKFINNIL